MPRVSWLMVAVLLVAQIAQAAPRDIGEPPDIDFLEFLGSWNTGEERWIDPFDVGEVPALETRDQDSEPRRSEAGDQTKRRPAEKARESSPNGTNVVVPLNDVKP